jgi:hypothetical protein
MNDTKPDLSPAEAHRIELEIRDLEIRDLRIRIEALEKRELERDRELRSSMLSIVAYLERTHGWEPKDPRRRNRPGSGSIPAPLSPP